ncbi:MAG: hypothetical protein KGN34_15250 [Sphingomonadales bacterium]|nr:hypothetical protein [Sphingomonadales bacterium]
MAAEPVTYKGQDFSSKGDKDRFVLPAKFRKLVTQSSEGRNELLVTLHPELQCLIGFGESYRDHRAALIRARADEAFLAGKDFDADAMNTIFGDAVEVSYDNSGRMIVPAYLRNIAGITDSIFFYGFGDTFLMWAPSVLAAEPDRKWALARAACAAMADLAAKGKGK